MMPLHPAIDELLQADVLTARSALDAVRDAIASNQLTKEEAKLMHEATLKEYATALRRFSIWVTEGNIPPDLR
jgi:hypothetical protein